MSTGSADRDSTAGVDAYKALGELGLSAEMITAYVSLLAGATTSSDVVTTTGLDAQEAKSALDALEREGLISRAEGDATTFAPTPPAGPLALRVREQERRTERSRDALRALNELYAQRPRPDDGTTFLEVVRGREAVVRHHLAALAEAQREVRGCTKYGRALTTAARVDGYFDALERGVPHRWIWEQSIFEESGMLDAARSCVELGEDLRSAESVPASIIVADDRVAVLHLPPRGAPGEPITIVSRHPAVVSLVGDFFESLWQRSTPLIFDQAPRSTRSSDVDLSDPLLSYLSAGLKDAAIARQLGVSSRTVARRVKELLSDLGVQTRFQAGLKLGFERSHDSVIARVDEVPRPVDSNGGSQD